MRSDETWSARLVYTVRLATGEQATHTYDLPDKPAEGIKAAKVFDETIMAGLNSREELHLFFPSSRYQPTAVYNRDWVVSVEFGTQDAGEYDEAIR